MIILHSAIHERRLLLWAEAAPETLAHLKRVQRKRAVELPPEAAHPYDAGVKGLAEAIGDFGFELSSKDDLDLAWAWLPTSSGSPPPSDPVIDEIDGPANSLAPWAVTSLLLSSEEAIEFLATLAEETERIGPDLSCLVTAFRFAASLVSRQQFLPGLAQEGGKYFARWEPVFLGEDAERLARLAQALPDSCRAVSRGEKGASPDHSPRRELSAFIGALVDHLIRSRNKIERVRKRVNFDSVDAQWLYALRSPDGRLEAKEISQFAERLRSWKRPIALASSVHFRLCLCLEEPEEEGNEDNEKAWTLRFLVQSLDDPSLMLPLAESGKLRVSGDLPIEEALLAALGQAAGIFPPIGKALAVGLPESCPLDSVEALDFLLDKAWLLKQAGFNLFLPAWWSKKGTKQRLSVKAKVPASLAEGDSIFSSVFDFDWKVALGDQELSAQELKALAKLKVPLVKVRGQWVQVDAKALRAAGDLSKRRSEITGRQLLRMALGQTENLPEGVSFGGLSAEGWVGNLLEQLNGNASFEELPPPSGFRGTLRPYQLRGYSWLHFLNRWGIGACLADDMGLGKTIQVLTLIQKEWEEKDSRKQPVLLICPTSVVGNWQREALRFTPDLPVLVHHGGGRAKGAKFKEEAKKQAIVISSYALLQRDAELLGKIPWRGVVLDEAQNVKNPETKQAKAARTIEADYRIALTGTPVENHLGELWSILDFLNPGLLGSQAAFKRDFLLPVQVYGEEEATEALKKLTSPFVLRRLKTDRTIIADLPEKLEMKVFCTLTKEQATLYQAVVEEATEALEESEGIKRKGIILATLTKLKQVCNHPAQFLGDRSELSGRSGKLNRLVELLEECLEVGDHSLLFTQFAEMGEMLKSFLQEAFGQEVLFLHGGVPKNKRDQMVERFQNDPDGPKIFILSLKAGGTGLNLTRANHVFHFDRWWNPAVENQATDRAFRIGQGKNVQVHKFLCPGTLEERIDEMIEKKQKLAEKVVGTGESWLTELSTEALKDLLTLRAEALEE
ncbi:MAG TPA: DEAD/DEAH box helicase [Chroococcales cyanobacterium]